MKLSPGQIAVVTGGGSGIGRELVRQLADEGLRVAMCDVSMAGMDETRELCIADGVKDSAQITSHMVDVADEQRVLRLRNEVAERHNTDAVQLLINNAGIGGGNSLFTDSRENWERTFNVCWLGVYYMTRAFLPMVVKSDQAHVINVSSCSGFWASLGPDRPNTAYSAAKFAVKGFTEALITDLKVNAPHVQCSVAMPGRIGTNIDANTRMVLKNRTSPGMTDDDVRRKRARMASEGVDVAQLSDAAIRATAADAAALKKSKSPTSAAEAATIILDGVRDNRWRIMVGRDAEGLDERVRATPEAAYDADFKGPFD